MKRCNFVFRVNSALLSLVSETKHHYLEKWLVLPSYGYCSVFDHGGFVLLATHWFDLAPFESESIFPPARQEEQISGYTGNQQGADVFCRHTMEPPVAFRNIWRRSHCTGNSTHLHLCITALNRVTVKFCPILCSVNPEIKSEPSSSC